MMANEGSYPENARGLAMNGAEVVYRASFPHRASDAYLAATVETLRGMANVRDVSSVMRVEGDAE